MWHLSGLLRIAKGTLWIYFLDMFFWLLFKMQKFISFSISCGSLHSSLALHQKMHYSPKSYLKIFSTCQDLCEEKTYIHSQNGTLYYIIKDVYTSRTSLS